MKISINCNNPNFLSKIDYVSIFVSLATHKYELLAKIKDAYHWQKIAAANTEEELKIWWDMQNSSAPLV